MDRLLEILKSRKFQTRLLSGIALVVLAVLVIMRGGALLFFVMMAVSMVGLFELYRVVNMEKEPIGFIGYAGGIAYYALLLVLIMGPANRHNVNDNTSGVAAVLRLMESLPQEARDRLAAFGFRGEDVFKPVSTLSGGERSRLKLCMLMGGDINLLILDEPTNHLDIVSREWMEDALSDYGETLLFVSHDRYFIEKFATRIWAFDGGVLTDYRGGWSDYVAWKERQTVFAAAEKKNAARPEVRKAGESPAAPGTQKALSRPHAGNQARQMQKAEKEIARLEGQLAALEEECARYATDYQKLMELEEQKESLNRALMEQYERWEALSDGA